MSPRRDNERLVRHRGYTERLRSIKAVRRSSSSISCRNRITRCLGHNHLLFDFGVRDEARCCSAYLPTASVHGCAPHGRAAAGSQISKACLGDASCVGRRARPRNVDQRADRHSYRDIRTDLQNDFTADRIHAADSLGRPNPAWNSVVGTGVLHESDSGGLCGHDVDPIAVQTARCFGLKQTAILRRICLPSAAPFIFTGIRISAAIGLIVVIGAELLASADSGIGSYILFVSSNGGQMDSVLAGAAIAGIIGALINSGLGLIDRRLFGWRYLGATPS